MQTILLAIEVLLAIGLISLILLQHGKGADAGAAFGSGASSTVFGSRGSGSFLSRATAILATLFFVVSMALAILANRAVSEPESITAYPDQQTTEVRTEADGDNDVPAPPSDNTGNAPASQSDVPAPPPAR